MKLPRPSLPRPSLPRPTLPRPTLPRLSLPPRVAHAARVSLAATLIVAIVYAGGIAILNRVVAARLIGEVDARLHERLSDTGGHPRPQAARSGDDDDVDADAAPVFFWLARRGADPVRLRSDGPRLPRELAPVSTRPYTVQLSPGSFRLVATRAGRAWLIAGQSLAEQQHIEGVLRQGELLGAPLLLLAMFAGSLIIGLRALSPVEQSRRRQLEFTADASHELRTPLSVISAETAIALSTPRGVGEYRATLARIDGESQRLRRIVEDLLWLARFDSRPPPPGDEPLDLATIADECADRFRSLGRSGGFEISVVAAGSTPAWISAPPEWIDRLAGVLTDNACRYAGRGGQVGIGVTARGGRICLVVEDSGPGIPAADQAHLFDRFHRSAEGGGAAGLGLAIADSIVRSTGGHWRIGDSQLGGARFEVSWRRTPPRRQRQDMSAPRPSALSAERPTSGDQPPAPPEAGAGVAAP